jgi:hypothetical protein
VGQDGGRTFEQFFAASYGRLVGLLFAVTTGPGAPALAQFGVSCRSELVVRELGQRAAAGVYMVRDGRPRRVPFRGDCWQADW